VLVLPWVLVSAACLAAPVHGGVVRAGPFVGYITQDYDVIHGRFRLHVGDYRNAATGLTQKIPWFISRRYPVAATALVVGQRRGSEDTFRTELHQTFSGSDSRRLVYPSSFSPPKAGCGRLTFTSGQVRGTLVVLVSNKRT
jgi:hypothetical protein